MLLLQKVCAIYCILLIFHLVSWLFSATFKSRFFYWHGISTVLPQRHLINSSQPQCEKSLKFCDPVIWNSIIVQSDCSPRELSAKSIGIAFPKKVPERARSNFITKEHSKIYHIHHHVSKLSKIIALHYFRNHIFIITSKEKHNWKLKDWQHITTSTLLMVLMATMMPRADSRRGCDSHDNHVTIMWQSWQSWQSWDNHDNHVTIMTIMTIMTRAGSHRGCDNVHPFNLGVVGSPDGQLYVCASNWSSLLLCFFSQLAVSCSCQHWQ